MYIMKRLSGGRGEYEIAELAGAVAPHDLIGKRLRWRIPPFRNRDSGIEVRAQGGKPRLRIAVDSAIHVHRQLAAIALLPKPIRDETSLTAQAPVFRQNQYILRKIDLGEVRIAGSALMRPSRIEADNGSGLVETVDTSDRLTRVRRVHELASEFPPALRSSIRRHEALLASDIPLTIDVEGTVADLMSSAARSQADLGAEYVTGTDVLPFLERVVGLSALNMPAAPLGEEVQIEVRRREASRLRRWAAARGVSSARFRRDVRDAYDSRCAVCGLKLPPGPDCEVAGVDAAHILPWSGYDLDVVGNGLCLCKLHHWAFDQQIIAITHDQGRYNVRITERGRRALEQDSMTLAELERFEGEIPASRLPADTRMRPRPQFLELFYARVPPDGD